MSSLVQSKPKMRELLIDFFSLVSRIVIIVFESSLREPDWCFELFYDAYPPEEFGL